MHNLAIATIVFLGVSAFTKLAQRAQSFAKTISTEGYHINTWSRVSYPPAYAKAAQTHTKRRRLCVLRYYCAAPRCV